MKIKSIGAFLLESLLIIFSVLMSFWIENWRQQRDDRRKEREYLIRVTKELDADSLLLNEIVEYHENLRMKTGEFLSSYTKWNGGRSLPVSNDSIASMISASLKAYDPFEPISSAYSSLKSNGQLDIIQDVDLADKFIHYYEQTTLSHHMRGHNNILNNELWPYLSNNVDLFDLYWVGQKKFGQTKSDYFKVYSGNQFKSTMAHFYLQSERIIYWATNYLSSLKDLRKSIKTRINPIDFN